MARCAMSRTRSIPAMPQEMLFNSTRVYKGICVKPIILSHGVAARQVNSFNRLLPARLSGRSSDISTCGGGVLNVGEGSVDERVPSEGGIRCRDACSCTHGMEMARPAECLHMTRQAQQCASVRRLRDPCNTKHPFHLHPFAQTEAHLRVWRFRCRNGLQGAGPKHTEACLSFAIAHRLARLNLSETAMCR